MRGNVEGTVATFRVLHHVHTGLQSNRIASTAPLVLPHVVASMMQQVNQSLMTLTPPCGRAAAVWELA